MLLIMPCECWLKYSSFGCWVREVCWMLWGKKCSQKVFHGYNFTKYVHDISLEHLHDTVCRGNRAVGMFKVISTSWTWKHHHRHKFSYVVHSNFFIISAETRLWLCLLWISNLDSRVLYDLTALPGRGLVNMKASLSPIQVFKFPRLQAFVGFRPEKAQMVISLNMKPRFRAYCNIWPHYLAEKITGAPSLPHSQEE